MKIKNLYVVDGLCPMSIMGTATSKTEDSYIRQALICKKVETGSKPYYQDIENNQKFYQINKIGIERVYGNPIPLSEYINFLGLRKRNNHENKKEVYQKVRKLRKNGIL